MHVVSTIFCDEPASAESWRSGFILARGPGDRADSPHGPRVLGVRLVASGAIISIPRRIYASSACSGLGMRISLVLRASPCFVPYHEAHCARGAAGITFGGWDPLLNRLLRLDYLSSDVPAL